MTRRPPVFGPEPWQGPWCHWDLWMCLVVLLDYDGDLDRFEERLIGDMGVLHGGRAAEAKWSHLVDLRRRLREVGVEPEDLVTAEHLADRTLVAKARRKVAVTGIERRAKTEAMIETPRVRLARRARYGSWGAFPVSPRPWYERFRRAVEVKHLVSADATFEKVATLEARLERLDRPRLPVAERLALYRAAHTALIELMERADDSYGEVGRFRDDVWETYLEIEWRHTGIDPDVYHRDLCELLVWEQYGLGFRREALSFEQVAPEEVDALAGILLDLEREHRQVHLRWAADEAVCQVAWLLIATGRTDRFADAARRIGSDHWRPIVAMAESALARDGKEAAYRVFAAANRPGLHRTHLAEQCRRLTGRPLRHLQAVPPEPRRNRDR